MERRGTLVNQSSTTAWRQTTQEPCHIVTGAGLTSVHRVKNGGRALFDSTHFVMIRVCGASKVSVSGSEDSEATVRADDRARRSRRSCF